MSTSVRALLKPVLVMERGVCGDGGETSRDTWGLNSGRWFSRGLAALSVRFQEGPAGLGDVGRDFTANCWGSGSVYSF